MAGVTKRYAYNVARALHWVGLVIIGFNLLSGWRLGGFELDVRQVLLSVHSSVGMAILFLMLFRWWWRRRYNLYTPPRWWKRPSMLIQWVFYPLTLLQVALGVALASVIDYEVLGFGFIPFSSLAPDSERLQTLFLQLHGNLALLLIALVAIHGFERWRLLFIDTPEPEPVRVTAGATPQQGSTDA